MDSKGILGIILVFLFSSSAFGQLEIYQDSLNYYYKKKDNDKVLVYVDRILQINPTSTYYLLHKGSILHESKNYRDAVRIFSKALLINPEITEGYVRRGISYLGLQEYDSSILDFTKAIGKYRHQDSVIYRYRGLAYLVTGKFELAKTDYDSAIKFNLHDKELLNNRAYAKMQLGDLKDARKDLDRAIDEDDNYLNAIKNRAIVNSQINDTQAALKDASHYLEYFPMDENINLIVGTLYFDMKDYENALQYFDKSKLKLKTKEVYHLSGVSHYYLAHDQQAINDLTQVFKFSLTQSEEAELYYLIGICKNNVAAKSGCMDIKKAIEKGQLDAKRIFNEQCD